MYWYIALFKDYYHHHQNNGKCNNIDCDTGKSIS